MVGLYKVSWSSLRSLKCNFTQLFWVLKYCSVFHSKLGWPPCTIGRSSFFTINHFNSILCSAYLHWKSWKREKKERNSWAAEPSRLTSLYIKLEFDLQNLQLQKWMKNKKNSCHCFKTTWYFGAKIQFFFCGVKIVKDSKLF